MFIHRVLATCADALQVVLASISKLAPVRADLSKNFGAESPTSSTEYNDVSVIQWPLCASCCIRVIQFRHEQIMLRSWLFAQASQCNIESAISSSRGGTHPCHRRHTKMLFAHAAHAWQAFARLSMVACNARCSRCAFLRSRLATASWAHTRESVCIAEQTTCS